MGQIQDLPMTYEGDPTDKLAKEPIFPIEVIDVTTNELNVLFQIEEGCHTFIHASNQLKTDAFLRLIIDPTYSKSKMPRWNYMVPKAERLFANIDQFGWFSKGVHLIDGTLYENVIFGRNELTLDDFTKAMDCVGLSYLNDKFYEGRDIFLSKANKLLSEEEREKILIARALVSSPQLFIISFFGLSFTVEDQIQILNNIENNYPKTTILCASKNLTHNHWNQFDLK